MTRHILPARTRRARVLAAVAASVAVAVVSTAAVLWHPWAGRTASADVIDRQTAVVERTSLSANLVLSAQLEYGAPTTLVGGPGMVTRLPRPGDTVVTGQPLYEVDGMAVVSFRGDRPLWRTVGSGMPDGPDVREVEQNLADLGFGQNLTIDDTFTGATERAISAWQKSLGRERTGVVEPGEVVMVNSAAVRVNTVTALVGGSAAGVVLSYTAPGIHGRITLSSDQLAQIAPGVAVSVRLPGGTETPATVGAVDPGGAPTTDPAKMTSPSATIDFADEAVVQGIGLPALRVTVGAGRADNALVVPVTALVALPGGGYGVELTESDGSTHTVAVELGLIADSRAEIRKAGGEDGGNAERGDVVEGDRVVVAG